MMRQDAEGMLKQLIAAEAEIEKASKQRDYYHDAWREAQKEVERLNELIKAEHAYDEFQRGEVMMTAPTGALGETEGEREPSIAERLVYTDSAAPPCA